MVTKFYGLSQNRKKNKENNLYSKYKKDLKRTQMRHNKLAQDLEKKTSKIYNI